MLKHLRTTAAALSIALPASVSSADTLQGQWVSETPENMGSFYATRAFEFTQDKWSITFDAFADEGATTLLFSVDVAGTYVVGADSAVEGAQDAVFHISTREVTASEIGVGIFADMGCTLVSGEAKDLRNEACGFLPSVMQSAIEYDLISLQNEQLFLGERTGDLSKERPSALIAYPLVSTSE